MTPGEDKAGRTLRAGENEKQHGGDDREGSLSARDQGDGAAGEQGDGTAGEQQIAAGEVCATPGEGHKSTTRAESGRKRSKKKKDRDLAELLSRKNELLQELQNRAGQAEQLNAKLEDRLLRLAAEFENFRKRSRREWELHEKTAAAGLIRDLLGVLDDFDRALAAAGPAGGDRFRDGVALIHGSLFEVLRRSGLSEIEALGVLFDPRYHEAVGEMENTDVEAGHIAEVVQKGYMFHDQVLRPARVIVARGTS